MIQTSLTLYADVMALLRGGTDRSSCSPNTHTVESRSYSLCCPPASSHMDPDQPHWCMPVFVTLELTSPFVCCTASGAKDDLKLSSQSARTDTHPHKSDFNSFENHLQMWFGSDLQKFSTNHNYLETANLPSDSRICFCSSYRCFSDILRPFHKQVTLLVVTLRYFLN